MTQKRIVDREIVYIPVRNLSVVWAQAQRPYNPKWAKEIAEDFDPDKFEPIVVTKPNGQGVYHIVEGQHRRHALEMYAARCNPTGRGDSEMAPCHVVAEANPARAAELWLGINGGRKGVRPIAGFIVAVTAKLEPQTDINSLLLANDYHVSSEKRPNCVAAVTALITVYQRHGRTTLSSTLRALRAMWDGDPNSMSSPMIRGFAIFTHEFGVYADVRRLKKIAEKWSPYDLWQAAEARKQSSLERLDEAIAELILREYNRGLKDGKLRRKE